MKKNAFVIFNSLTIGLLLVQPALAQFGFTINDTNINNVANLNTILTNVTNVVLGLLVAVAVIFAIYSGYLYLTAQGDTTKVKTASTMLIYAGVAVGVGLLSKGIINLVLGILNTSTKI